MIKTELFLKINKIIHLVAFFFIISFNSCKDDKITNAGSNNYIVPLNIGNQWVYRNYYYPLGDTSLVSETGTEYSITKDTVINNERWFLISSAGFPQGNRADGYYLLKKDNAGNEKPILYIPYPAQKGEEVVTGYGILKVVSVDTTITVDGNIYRCYCYSPKEEFPNSGFTLMFYSPGVGNVLTESYAVNGSTGKIFLQQRYVLKYFKGN